MIRFRHLVAASLLLLTLLWPLETTGQGDALLEEISPRFRKGVERALLGANDAELRASFRKLMTPVEQSAWAFLVASTPAEAVEKLTDAMLTEQVMYAALARESLPWCQGLTEESFRHYVLPFVLERGEPRAGRRERYTEIAPLLREKRADTLAKAALILNRLLTERRSLGPLPVDRVRSYVRFARSVGIPARIARTPFFPHRAGGGTWCEVFDGNRWRYLEPGRPADQLDRTSFQSDLARVAIVLSKTIGVPEGEEVVATDGELSVVNSSALYTKTCRMTVVVRDASADPCEDAKVCLNLFNEEGNNAYLRAGLTARTGREGTFAFDLGPGDYLFSAASGGEIGWAAARSAPDRRATCAITTRKPVTDPSSKFTPTGRTAIQVHLGGGGGGDMTAAIARLKIIPWFFFGFVGGGGQTADLEPGFYAVSTSWRRSANTVLVSVQAVEVKKGQTVTVTTPNFPKSSGRPEAGENAWILRYP